MSYALHIRIPDDDITLDGWRQYLAENQRDFISTDTAEIAIPGMGTISLPGRAFGQWTGHSSGDRAWFVYGHGEITVSDPDDETIARMKEIAQVFGATVYGDEGEEY